MHPSTVSHSNALHVAGALPLYVHSLPQLRCGVACDWDMRVFGRVGAVEVSVSPLWDHHELCLPLGCGTWLFQMTHGCKNEHVPKSVCRSELQFYCHQPCLEPNYGMEGLLMM